MCHRLNPKPQKKKKETESETEPSADKEGGGAKDGDADEESMKEDLGTPGQSVPSDWKQFNTDLDTALESGSAGGVVKGGVGEREIADLNKDLMQLNFDPFSAPMANGAPLSMDPFQPMGGQAVSGTSGAVAYPPLTVSNLSTSLPDFPDGVDPATAAAGVPPPHMAILGRPRPRPSISGQQQVCSSSRRVS